MKLFMVNDCDWWAGESAESIKPEALKMYGSLEETEFEDGGAPAALGDDLMDKLIFNDEGTLRTFRAELDRLITAGATFPRFFASTEY